MKNCDLYQIYNELITIITIMCVSLIFFIGFGKLAGLFAYQGSSTANNLDDRNYSALLYAAENGNIFGGIGVAFLFPPFPYSSLAKIRRAIQWLIYMIEILFSEHVDAIQALIARGAAIDSASVVVAAVKKSKQMK